MHETLTPDEWDQRVLTLAEELGRAKAHTCSNIGSQYRHTNDGELFEETVFALRRLRAQREQVAINVDALSTAAFAYQLMLNVSHERALALDEQK
jgi:predicted DNA-binding protein